jgi:hypothetical protein
MAETRRVTTRVPEGLEAAARASSPELAGLDLSTLVRVGLAVLAGHPVPAALDLAERARSKRGPKPREEQAA